MNVCVEQWWNDNCQEVTEVLGEKHLKRHVY